MPALTAPAGRDGYLPALILALLVVLVPVYAWHDNTSGFLSDDGLYLMMADFFSPWFDPNVHVNLLVIEHARFPPAFPVLLGLAGGGSQNMAAAHLVTGACFVGSALMVYVWARGILPLTQLALACLFIYVILPESLIYVLELRSEFLYIAVTLAALTALDTAGRPGAREREWLCLAAILIGLSMLTRTVGAALLAALAIHLLINHVPRKWLYMSIAAALPVCWYVIKTINGYSNFYVEDVARYAGYEGIWRLVTQDLPGNARLLLSSWSTLLGAGEQSTWIGRTLAMVLLLPALAGFAQRIRYRRPDAFYVVLYIAVILVWPHPDHMVRFLYPLVPLGLVYVFAGLSALAATRRGPARRTHALTLFVVLALVYPDTLSLIDRYSTPPPARIPDDFRHTRDWLQTGDGEIRNSGAETKHHVITLLRRVPHQLEPHECLYADHFPLSMLYARRPVEQLTSNLAPRWLRKCDYLFVMNLVAQHPEKYPLGVIDHNRLVLVDLEYDTRGRQQAYLFTIKD